MLLLSSYDMVIPVQRKIANVEMTIIYKHHSLSKHDVTLRSNLNNGHSRLNRGLLIFVETDNSYNKFRFLNRVTESHKIFLNYFLLYSYNTPRDCHSYILGDHTKTLATFNKPLNKIGTYK